MNPLKQSIRAGFVVFLCVVGGACQSQTQQIRSREHSLLSQTVSISTLQVPLKAWKHFEKARRAAEHNRPVESKEESTKALEIAPNFAKAYVLRATQEIREEQFEDAIADAASAIKFDPGVQWGSVILAGAYSSTHRYKNALLVLDNLRGPDLDSWQAKFERARAEIGCGNIEAALYWSAQVADIAPKTVSDVDIVRIDALVLAHRWNEAAAQMNLYLQSKEPQPHHDQVVALLMRVRTRMDPAATSEVASR